MSKFYEILANIGLIGAAMGPVFMKSEHGQAILNASENLILAEMQAAQLAQAQKVSQAQQAAQGTPLSPALAGLAGSNASIIGAPTT